jgi:hypothetical protein
MVMTRAETRGWHPLRPRHLAVPSSRPRPRSGCTAGVRQCGVQVRGRGRPPASRGPRAVGPEPERRSKHRPQDRGYRASVLRRVL